MSPGFSFSNVLRGITVRVTRGLHSLVAASISLCYS